MRHGAFVARGRCEYPLRTHEPTGLIEVATGRAVRLGDLFGIWGQPLSRKRLLGFTSQAEITFGKLLNSSCTLAFVTVPKEPQDQGGRMIDVLSVMPRG